MYKDISHHTACICFSYGCRHVALFSFSHFFQSRCGGKDQDLHSPLPEVITSAQSCSFAFGAENVKERKRQEERSAAMKGCQVQGLTV